LPAFPGAAHAQAEPTQPPQTSWGDTHRPPLWCIAANVFPSPYPQVARDILSTTLENVACPESSFMNRILHATKFAAEKHAQQRRKNADATPYINHPIEVAEHLARIGGVSDEDVLIAALLHDTIEDTQTNYQEIADLFGIRVASIVLECTDDKSLEKAERKRLQIVIAPKKCPEAKCVKIADKTCNLSSIISDPPNDWSVQRQREYFGWAERVVAGLLGVNDPLDAYVKEVLARGKAALEKLAAKSIQSG
ncbi:MAG: HD domain-containing protein, partial [Planctomycetota bacterium]